MSRLADGTQSFTGILDQVVDVAQASSLIGAPDFAGQTLTFSVENLSAPISVTIGSKTASLTEGPGRRSVTVTLDASSTGHLLLRLQGSGTTTFLRPKLEIGERATPWIGNWLDVEEHRCRRYYHRITTTGTTLLPVARAGATKRSEPDRAAIPVSGDDARGSGDPDVEHVLGRRFACGQPDFMLRPGRRHLALGFGKRPHHLRGPDLRFGDRAGDSWPRSRLRTGGTVCQVHFGNTAFIGLQAEL